VELSVLGTNGPIADPATLNSLKVGMTVSGDGLPSGSVPIGTTAKPGCSVQGPGTFLGTLKAPNQQGTLTFTGSAVGYGIFTSNPPTTVAVGTPTTGFTAVVNLPIVSSVQAGGGITGQVSFTNQTGSARKVELRISSSGAHPAITGVSNPLSVSSGSPSSSQFTVAFPRSSPTGTTWFQVTAVDAANPAVVYGVQSLEVTVTKPPGFWAQYLWDVIGIILAIIALILFIIWRRALHRWRMDVRGLVVLLQREGAQLYRLNAKDLWDDSFRFALREENGHYLLDYPQPGLSEYTAVRSGNREVALTTPTGETHKHITIGGQGDPVPGTGLDLAFADRSHIGPWWTLGAARGPRRPDKDKSPTSVRAKPAVAAPTLIPAAPEQPNPGPGATQAPDDELL
jgi:hypothetical protein